MADKRDKRSRRKARRKKPVALAVTADDRPKALGRLEGDEGQRLKPVFSFSITDRAYQGEWGWPLLTAAEAVVLVHFMCDMCALTWDEVRAQTASGHKRHHYHPVASVCADAQKRIEDLELDDMPVKMFRFRLTGEQRLWGWEENGVFHALWWDPNHRVYPTEPD